MKLCQEIMAVLNDIKTCDKGGGPPTDLRHMASQTVFSVLDHLTKWTRHRMTEIAVQSGPTASNSKTSTSSASGTLIVKSLHTSILNNSAWKKMPNQLNIVSMFYFIFWYHLHVESFHILLRLMYNFIE